MVITVTIKYGTKVILEISITILLRTNWTQIKNKTKNQMQFANKFPKKIQSIWFFLLFEM